MGTPEVRRLAASDAEAFAALRLAGLAESPTAFGSSPEEDLARDPELTRQRVSERGDDAIFGAFERGLLVGVVGLHRETHAKGRHHATVWGMYVAPAHREKGHGRALVTALIRHAQTLEDLCWLQLGVDTRNAAARALYGQLGFETWGIERDALRVGDEQIDEEHMALDLGIEIPS